MTGPLNTLASNGCVAARDIAAFEKKNGMEKWT